MRKIILPKKELTGLTDATITACLQHEDVTYANGTEANNHLDLGYDDISDCNPLKYRIGVCATALILESGAKPQFIATVPTGADGWGDKICARIGDPSIARIKSTKLKRREFANTDASYKIIQELKNSHNQPHGIIVDDATTDGGTTEVYADFLVDQGLEIDLALSLFYRGNLKELKSNYKRAILLSKYIPPMLDWDEYDKSRQLVGKTT